MIDTSSFLHRTAPLDTFSSKVLVLSDIFSWRMSCKGLATVLQDEEAMATRFTQFFHGILQPLKDNSRRVQRNWGIQNRQYRWRSFAATGALSSKSVAVFGASQFSKQHDSGLCIQVALGLRCLEFGGRPNWIVFDSTCLFDANEMQTDQSEARPPALWGVGWVGCLPLRIAFSKRKHWNAKLFEAFCRGIPRLLDNHDPKFPKTDTEVLFSYTCRDGSYLVLEINRNHPARQLCPFRILYIYIMLWLRRGWGVNLRQMDSVVLFSLIITA